MKQAYLYTITEIEERWNKETKEWCFCDAEEYQHFLNLQNAEESLEKLQQKPQDDSSIRYTYKIVPTPLAG